MSRLLWTAPLSVALLALSLTPIRGQSGATIKWVDPSPSPPEAYAPIPPKVPPPSAAPEPSAQVKPAEKAPPPEASPEPQQGSSRPPATKPDAPHPQRPATPVRLAPEQAPDTAGPELSPLPTAAGNFINAYWANVGGTSDQVLPYLASIYAPIVDYYNKPASRETILKDKYAFIRRWPMRQTWAPPGSAVPQISCEDRTAECEITGLRDFDAVSPERGARSSGVVRYRYRVRFADRRVQIVAEDSQVVARE